MILSINSINAQKIRDKEYHSPGKAALKSALIPGWGQLYNKKYYKVPIVYALLGGAIYAVAWNNSNYSKYNDAFIEFKSYSALETAQEKKDYKFKSLGKVFDVKSVSADNEEWLLGALKNKKTRYKRDRDFSIIVLAGVYFLNIIDATVDAHFFNYSISDDLSLKLEPVIQNYAYSNNFGLKCSFTF